MLLVKILVRYVQLVSKIERASGNDVGYKRMCVRCSQDRLEHHHLEARGTSTTRHDPSLTEAIAYNKTDSHYSSTSSDLSSRRHGKIRPHVFDVIVPSVLRENDLQLVNIAATVQSGRVESNDSYKGHKVIIQYDLRSLCASWNVSEYSGITIGCQHEGRNINASAFEPLTPHALS